MIPGDTGHPTSQLHQHSRYPLRQCGDGYFFWTEPNWLCRSEIVLNKKAPVKSDGGFLRYPLIVSGG